MPYVMLQAVSQRLCRVFTLDAIGMPAMNGRIRLLHGGGTADEEAGRQMPILARSAWCSVRVE
jgi:hypothetical protein